ncbi:unnamed protein product [Clonostachys rosea f. rosea IK726]|uniref:Ubiquitin carrier protein n=2 Tax=Bionectria ochroleuca TaxID=29856 RepID=A0A0B7JHF3_BIOOC|nr:unnamed protein product [Clonostachys rosea f. rosea IK726]
MLQNIGSAIYKRSLEAAGDQAVLVQLPWWTPIVFFINVLLIVPIVFCLDYTLQTLYPTFVIVEDENAPDFEPLVPKSPKNGKSGDEEEDVPVTPAPVSNSIRSIYRLLRANGGFFANFRGLSIYLVERFITVIILHSAIRCLGLYLGLILGPVLHLLCNLLLAQLSTAWVHIAITPASPLRWWRRLPAFSTTVKAVWGPMFLFSIASFLAEWAPFVIAKAVHFPLGFHAAMVAQDGQKPTLGFACLLLVKYFAVLAGSIFAVILLIVPTRMILVRVQASLLPVDEDAIVPFDRSFGGRVQTALVGGRGFATITDVWSTFSRAVMGRLVKLHVKVIVINVLVGFVLGAFVVFPSVLAVTTYSTVVKA